MVVVRVVTVLRNWGCVLSQPVLRLMGSLVVKMAGEPVCTLQGLYVRAQSSEPYIIKTKTAKSVHFINQYTVTLAFMLHGKSLNYTSRNYFEGNTKCWHK